MSLNTKKISIIGIISILIGLILLISLFLSGKLPLYDATGFPIGPVSYEFVKSRPEAQLFYPGAEVFHRFGGKEIGFFTSPSSSAFAGGILMSNNSPEQIYQWYKEWLLTRGWQPADFLLVDTQISLQGYTRGNREDFYVAMNNPKRLAATLGRPVPDNVTIFEVRYVIIPNAWVEKQD